jgi:hypothetical protein
MQTHFGTHDFRMGELKRFRVEMYPTLAAANADAANAAARIIFVLETGLCYAGSSGSWTAIGSGGGAAGTALGVLPSEAALPVSYGTLAANVLATDATTATITVDLVPGLSAVEAGDALAITGSTPGGWLDGTYSVLAINTGTGVVQLAGGTVPVNPGGSTFGSGVFSDLTTPTLGLSYMVEADTETGEPALYILGPNGWFTVGVDDPRVSLVDGSRAFSRSPEVTSRDRVSGNQLVPFTALQGALDGALVGPITITSADSTGATTVIAITTTHNAGVTASDTITITGSPVDGTYTVASATFTLPAQLSVTLTTNIGWTTVATAAQATVYRPGEALATVSEVQAASGDISAHVADPAAHAAAIATAVTGHANDAAAHTAQFTAAANALAAHDANASAHSAMQATITASIPSTVAAVVAAHDASATAHPDFARASTVEANLAAHNADPGAHAAALSASGGGGSFGGGTTLSGIVLPVDFARPVHLRPGTDVWEAPTLVTEEPQALAGKSSTSQALYSSISVTFAAGSCTLPTTVRGCVSRDDHVAFLGAALNTGIFRVATVLDDVVTLTPAPVVEGPVTVGLTKWNSDGFVVAAGFVTIPNGSVRRTGLSALAGVSSSGAIDLFVARASLTDIRAGDIAILSGNSTGADGTYRIRGLSDNLAFVTQTIVPGGAPISAITTATNTVTMDGAVDLSAVIPDDSILIVGTPETNGVYRILSVSGQDIVVTPDVPLPGADYAGGTATISREVDTQATRLLLERENVATLSAAAIQAITVADRTIEFAGAVDLSELQLGGPLAVVGTVNNNGTYTVESIDGQIVTVVEPLPGTDGGAAGTGSQTTTVPTLAGNTDWSLADGTVTLQWPTKTHGFSTSVPVRGARYYNDPASVGGISTTAPSPAHIVARQLDEDRFKVQLQGAP